MGLLVYKFSEYNHTAEREQYRNLCKQLYAHYASSTELCIFIANYNIFDSELDGIIIKQDAIICVEFKNYGGVIIAVDNGNWKLDDGTIIKGGSRKSVYQQARVNRCALKNGFNEGGILPVKMLQDVATLVVFHQPITLQNNLSSKTRSWLHISDETNFMEKVCDITNCKMSLEAEDMQQLMVKLNLTEEFRDREYSNYAESKIDNFDTGSLEGEDQEQATPTGAVLSTWDEESTDKDQEGLCSFIKQIVSTLFQEENYYVRVLRTSQIEFELPAEQQELLKSYRHIVLVNGDSISTKAERLGKFVHKKVYILDEKNVYWGSGYISLVENKTSDERNIQEKSPEVSFRKSRTTLPHWLDKFLFEQLTAVYAPEYSRYEYNLDLSENEVGIYLGTYFPRSYAEVFCIADNLFQNSNVMSLLDSLQKIRIFDFCAGTGGELMGLLCAIDKYFAEGKTIEILACDGNEIALGKLSQILEAHSSRTPHQINVRIEKYTISSEEDIARLTNAHDKYDFVLCNKVVCELISHNIVRSGYKGVARNLYKKISVNGLLLMLDVTTKEDKSQKFYPQLMNSQINELAREDEGLETLLPLSCATYKECKTGCFIQQSFVITHSHKQKDESRVCYRILCRKEFKEKMWSKRLGGFAHIVNPQKYKQGLDDARCIYSNGCDTTSIDSYNINIL